MIMDLDSDRIKSERKKRRGISSRLDNKLYRYGVTLFNPSSNTLIIKRYSGGLPRGWDSILPMQGAPGLIPGQGTVNRSHTPHIIISHDATKKDPANRTKTWHSSQINKYLKKMFWGDRGQYIEYMRTLNNKKTTQLKHEHTIPGGAAVGSPPANEGGHRFEPWSGKISHATRQLGLCATATEPACPSPRAVTTEAWAPRACTLQQEKPPQWEARAPLLERTPCSLQLGNSLRTATKTQHSQK